VAARSSLIGAFWQPEFDVNVNRLDLGEGTEFFPITSHVWPFGCNMFTQAEALRKVGGFRKDLGMNGARMGWGEETDWFQRHAAAGGLVGYVWDARITHWVNPKNLTRWRLLRRAYLTGVYNAKLHNGPDDLRGWGAWFRHSLGAVRRGNLGLAHQLYLLHWLGKLRGSR
jgi:GT2 family glycosyltransferase